MNQFDDEGDEPQECEKCRRKYPLGKLEFVNIVGRSDYLLCESCIKDVEKFIKKNIQLKSSE